MADTIELKGTILPIEEARKAALEFWRTTRSRDWGWMFRNINEVLQGEQPKKQKTWEIVTLKFLKEYQSRTWAAVVALVALFVLSIPFNHGEAEEVPATATPTAPGQPAEITEVVPTLIPGPQVVIPETAQAIGGVAPVTVEGNGSFVSNATHTVQPGENLFRIAQRYGVSLDALVRENSITNPQLIWAGQVLKIPGRVTQPVLEVTPVVPEVNPTAQILAQVAATPMATPVRGQIFPGVEMPLPVVPPETLGTMIDAKRYRVNQNDTLFGISLLFGTSVQQIKAWNGLTTDTIYLGQTLQVFP
jgi:LysM repeat protein